MLAERKRRNWGGCRPGSGRKKGIVLRDTYTVRLTPGTIDKVRSLAVCRGQKQCDLVEDLIAEEFEKYRNMDI